MEELKVELQDLRNDLAKARDEFMLNPNNKHLFNPKNLGDTPVYLRNRIESAFIAGWNARAKALEDET